MKSKITYDASLQSFDAKPPYKRLSPVKIVFCSLGAFIGFYASYIAVQCLIGHAKPENPHRWKIINLSGIGALFAFFFGVLAIILLSLCVPKLIFRTAKEEQFPTVHKVVKVVLPVVLSISLVAGLTISSNSHSAYTDPAFSYKGTEFTYYEDSGIFVLTAISGLASDDDVPEKLVIPEVINGHDVDRIDPGAFEGYTEITEVVIPDSVQRICEDAFRGCSSLKKVTLGKDLRTIEKNAFKDCVSLTDITEPQEMKGTNILGLTYTYIYEFDKDAFNGCKKAPSWTRDSKYFIIETEEE